MSKKAEEISSERQRGRKSVKDSYKLTERERERERERDVELHRVRNSEN
jgi:hypothetical protein